MKLKHTFIGILSTCALGLASCDLNITPDSYIADINFYQNEAEVNTPSSVVTEAYTLH